jgi:hypothetical protein
MTAKEFDYYQLNINLSWPVVASKWVFFEAKVSTTIDMFSCIGADVN